MDRCLKKRKTNRGMELEKLMVANKASLAFLRGPSHRSICIGLATDPVWQSTSWQLYSHCGI